MEVKPLNANEILARAKNVIHYVEKNLKVKSVYTFRIKLNPKLLRMRVYWSEGRLQKYFRVHDLVKTYKLSSRIRRKMVYAPPEALRTLRVPFHKHNQKSQCADSFYFAFPAEALSYVLDFIADLFESYPKIKENWVACNTHLMLKPNGNTPS